MLLEKESVNCDQANTEHRQTPLSWEANNGHEESVDAFWRGGRRSKPGKDFLSPETTLAGG